MFRIKKEQMDHFAELSTERFVRRLVDHLSREHATLVKRAAGATTPERGGALEVWVRAAVEKASHYRITTQPEAAQLVLLMLVIGADADEKHPWVREVLTNKNLFAIGKLRRLIRRARAHGVADLDEVLVYPEMSDVRPEVEFEALEA